MRMSHIIFLVENRAILYIVIFFHGKDGYGEIALYNTGLLGVEETLHRYKTGRYSRIPLKIRG